MELEDALAIMIDVLEALGFAHVEGVIHRDIKPENIFLAQNGPETVTKLLDFGIMRVVDGDGRITGGHFVGTFQYAAPEQLQGRPVSEQTDIYAAGCVLFEMLAGRGPFDEEKDAKRIGAARLHRDAPALSQFADVPAEVSRLVAAALERSEDKRPRNATSLAAQLYVVRQKLRSAATATANTTDESLLTAVASAAHSSGRVKALSGPPIPLTPAEAAAASPAFGGTRENAPPAALATMVTRTADVAGEARVPTEVLSEGGPPPAASRAPERGPDENPLGRGTANPRSTWLHRWRPVAPHALAGAAVAVVLVVLWAWLAGPQVRPTNHEQRSPARE